MIMFPPWEILSVNLATLGIYVAEMIPAASPGEGVTKPVVAWV